MGNFTGGAGGGGHGVRGGVGGGAGGWSGTGAGASQGRAAPDERSRVTLRWVVAGPAEGLDRALAKAAKRGCKAANRHLTWRGGTKAQGELRPHAEGGLAVVRVEIRSDRLKGVPVGVAFDAFADAFEKTLHETGVRARRLSS